MSIKSGLAGVAVGGVITLLAVFAWPGFGMLKSDAENMARDRAAQEVAAAVTPFCVEKALADPEAATLIAELQSTRSAIDRRNAVRDVGWAGTNPNVALLTSCARELSGINLADLASAAS